MAKMRIEGGFNEPDKEFKAWRNEGIAEAKQGFRLAMGQWSREIQFNVPKGPPHKKKAEMPDPYHIGALAETTRLEFDESDNHIEGTVSVGEAVGPINYARFVSAREGTEFFEGETEAVAEIDRALRQGREEDL